MKDRLTIGSGVMSDLILGAVMRHGPGEEMGKVATRVALEVVIEITDRVG